MKKICFAIALSILSGCATQVPSAISSFPDTQVMLAEVRTEPEQFVGSEVRWGGVIVKVENMAAQTQVEVVSRELKKNAQPRINSKSEGRFIASFQGFIDPAVYGPGRQLTVIGTISGEITRKIGEYAYLYPVVNVTSFYLWQEEPEPMRYDYPYSPPWYYDPWPFYHRPYYPPYYW